MAWPTPADAQVVQSGDHVWEVFPTGDPGRDFDNIQIAIDASAEGDVLHLHYDAMDPLRPGIGSGVATDFVLRGYPLDGAPCHKSVVCRAGANQRVSNPAGDDIPATKTGSFADYDSKLRQGLSFGKGLHVIGDVDANNEPLTRITMEHPFSWTTYRDDPGWSFGTHFNTIWGDPPEATSAYNAATDAIPWYFHGGYSTVENLHFYQYAGALEAWYPATFRNITWEEAGQNPVWFLADRRVVYPEGEASAPILSYLEDSRFIRSVSMAQVSSSGVIVRRNQGDFSERGAQWGILNAYGMAFLVDYFDLGDVDLSLVADCRFEDNVIVQGNAKGSDFAPFAVSVIDYWGATVRDVTFARNTITHLPSEPQWTVGIAVWSENQTTWFSEFGIGPLLPSEVRDITVHDNVLLGMLEDAISVYNATRTEVFEVGGVSSVGVTHNTIDAYTHPQRAPWPPVYAIGAANTWFIGNDYRGIEEAPGNSDVPAFGGVHLLIGATDCLVQDIGGYPTGQDSPGEWTSDLDGDNNRIVGTSANTQDTDPGVGSHAAARGHHGRGP